MNPSGAAQEGKYTEHSLEKYYRFHSRIYDATRWLFLFGRDRLIKTAALFTRPRRILEVGCGTGKNLVRLRQTFPGAEPDRTGPKRRYARGGQKEDGLCQAAGRTAAPVI